jgi:hypothetical protein
VAFSQPGSRFITSQNDRGIPIGASKPTRMAPPSARAAAAAMTDATVHFD